MTFPFYFAIIFSNPQSSVLRDDKESNKLSTFAFNLCRVLRLHPARLPGGPQGTPTPSPRCSTPRWRKHSRPLLLEWNGLSDTLLRLPGTEATWILCKGFSAIPSAIPRKNPRTQSLSPLSLTNCSFSSKAAKW